LLVRLAAGKEKRAKKRGEVETPWIKEKKGEKKGKDSKEVNSEAFFSP